MTLVERYHQIADTLEGQINPKDFDGKLLRLLAYDYRYIADMLADAMQHGTVERLVGELRAGLNRSLFYMYARKRNETLKVVATTIERSIVRVEKVVPTFALDERVIVDFGGGEEYHGEIDSIDFEGDPEHPYRVWYDTPRLDPSWGKHAPIEIECEWVAETMLRREKEKTDV